MARSGGRLTVAYIDIDHFKALNDAHGHDAGDAVLVNLAQLITDTIRDKDTLFRIGGKEFAVLLVDTGVETARTIAERVRKAVAEAVVEHQGVRASVTVSIGVASLPPASLDIVDDVIAGADGALDAAKRAGRDRVELVDTNGSDDG